MDLIRYFEQLQTKSIDRPRLRAGDVVRVETKIKEGDKTRLQTFEGTVLGVRGTGPSTTFTVRRETGRFAVERIFPLYNPIITNIDITKRQKVRRAKLSYLRQAGRRRVKEDELALQRHLKEEEEQKRVAEAKKAKAAKEKEAYDLTVKEAAKEKDKAEQADAPKAEAAPEVKDIKEPEEKATDAEPKDKPEDK